MKEIHNNQQEYTDDDLDLLHLIHILIDGKWVIFSITSILSIIGVTYSLLLPNVYESKAILVPVEPSSTLSGALKNYSSLAGLAGVSLPSSSDDSNSIKAKSKINSLSFFENNILPNLYLPDLMAVKHWEHSTNTIIYDDSLYDEETKTWVRKYSYPEKQIPSPQESFLEFTEEHLNLIEDKQTGFIILSLKHQSPYIAKQWIEIIIKEINSFYRQKDKLESQKALNYLNNRIQMTNLSEIKQVIAELMQQETQKLTLIEAKESYVFDYIDPPAVMERKSEPKRIFICILSALFGFILSIMVVFTRNFISLDKAA